MLRSSSSSRPKRIQLEVDSDDSQEQFEHEQKDETTRFGCISLSPNEAKHLKVPKGNRYLPVLGETLSFLMNTQKFFQNRFEKYGKLFSSHVLFKPTIIIGDVEISRQLLAKEGKWVREDIPESLKQLLGDKNILTTHGKAHKEIRLVLQRNGLSSEKTCSYIDVIQEMAIQHTKSWVGDIKDNKIFPKLKEFVFAASCRVILGLKFEESTMKKMLDLYDIFIKGTISLPINVPGTSFHKSLEAKKKLKSIIKEHLDSGKFEDDSLIPIISALKKYQQENNKYDVDELVDQGVFFLAVSLDTTLSSLAGLLLLIAYYDEKHGGLFEKLKDEQNKIISKHGQSLTREIILNEMPLLHSCHTEAMQILPVIAGLFRTALTDIQISPTEKIPKGYQIMVGLMDNHPIPQELPLEWKDRFDYFEPRRWLNKKTKAMSFGFGQRRCLGYHFIREVEIPVLMATLIRNFKWELKENTHEIPFVGMPAAHPQDGLKIKFHNL